MCRNKEVTTYMAEERSNGKDREIKSELHAVRPIQPQIMVASACCFASICCGFAGGHTAVLLPRLQQNDSSLSTDEETGSWIASSFSASIPVGTMIGGALSDQLGRRMVLRIAQVPLCVGWLMTSCAQNHQTMIAARFVTGFARAMTGEAIMVYLDEHTDGRLRGMFSCFTGVCYMLGMLAVMGVDAILGWRSLAGLGAAGPAIFFIATWFISETPVWLVRHGKVIEADSVLERAWGNRHKSQARKDLENMVARCEKDENLWKSGRFCGALTRPHVLKPFLISFMFTFLQILCGTSLFVSYTVEIIAKCRRGNRDILDEFSAATVSGAVRLAVFTAMTCLMSIVGRRTIALSSNAGSAVCCLALGTTLYLNSVGGFMSEETEGWLTLMLIFAYVFTSTGMFFLLPALMTGEMLPSRVRGTGSGFMYAFNDVGSAGIVKIFPWISQSLGMHGMFWLFSASYIVTAVFVFLFIPETQGRSLAQIEEYFQGPNILWHRRGSKSRSVPIVKDQEAIPLQEE